MRNPRLLPLFSFALLPLLACGGPPPAHPVAPPPAAAPASGVASSSAAAVTMDLEAVPTVRLPADTRPTAERLELHIDPKQDRFSGVVDIDVVLDQYRSTLWLHGEGLNVTRATATADGGKEIAGAWAQRAPSGVASITFPERLPAGKVRLHIAYDAPFDRALEGIHKITQEGLSYAFTQFEEIAARKAFPCFDEPGFKIPFDTTLVVPADAQVVANTREIDRKVEGGSVRVHFAQTVPLPSYLLAFAVGPLDIVAAPDVPPNGVRSRPLPLRAVTTHGHGKEAAYALAHTGEILTGLEQFFGIEYPFDKLDVIAVPDKGGAMENPGALTFEDALLLFDGKTAPVWQRRAYAYVMAHELAHQWTGDLVTAAWWDDIWLNEAFATWIGSKIADQWDPKLDVALRGLLRVQDAMGEDALVTARSIRQPIASTNDIGNAFDSITYQKGGAVLAMFEQWVGADVFRRGLHDYLVRHRFGSATADDFLSAESAAAGRDVRTPFHTFLDQPGVPLLETQVVCDGAPRLHLKQSRYLPLGSTGVADEIWQIPVCARYGGQRGLKESCTLLTARDGDLALDGGCPKWVLPNADDAGYFRFAVAPADLAALKKNGLPDLDVRERLAYANGLRAGYNRGVLPMADVIEASAALASDPHAEIAREPIGFVEVSREWLHGDPLRASVEAYGRRLFDAEGKKLGWVKGLGDGAERTDLRTTVLRFLSSVARDPAVRAEAKRRGLAYLGDGRDGTIHRDAVAPELADVALAVVGDEADPARWESIRSLLGKTEDPVIRGSLLAALTAAHGPELTARVRDLAFDPALRVTEKTDGVWARLRDPDTREETWQWVKANLDRIAAVLPEHGRTQLIGMGRVFCDEDHAKDLEAFFTPARLATIDGGPRALANTLEDVRLCASVRAKQEPSARAFFQAHEQK